MWKSKEQAKNTKLKGTFKVKGKCNNFINESVTIH